MRVTSDSEVRTWEGRVSDLVILLETIVRHERKIPWIHESGPNIEDTGDTDQAHEDMGSVIV